MTESDHLYLPRSQGARMGSSHDTCWYVLSHVNSYC